ncbi:MAG: 3-hydroxyacyl-CoA dehydrogenase [Devosia nanyangense]|uniref:L-gulonate 3-dehydrogenase n=1 Tax=Devosia nanyangense TaxID=1228055 RepID=A0A933L2X2_9HYPH|nr:3-hydroxyacyl-CoA dehydrogenase [Devosia nanyangense]
MSTADPVAIVGTGLVGMGWAIVFARAGRSVRLHDSVPGMAEKARATAAQRLTDLAAAELIDEPVGDVLARIAIAETLAAAVDGAAYVQESVFETAPVKTAVFSDLDAVLGERTIVGSSSSGIPASVYTGHVGFRARSLVVHPVNPPYLIPAVELVPAPWTQAATVAAARSLMLEVGQAPIVLTREINGFVLNRLQGVLLMEAWKLYEEGIASLEDIDLTVSAGLGLRWAFMGPFETIDLNAVGGISDYARRLAPLFADIAAERDGTHRPWPDAVVQRAEGDRDARLARAQLPDRSGWRDRRLMALARWRKAQPES